MRQSWIACVILLAFVAFGIAEDKPKDKPEPKSESKQVDEIIFALAQKAMNAKDKEEKHRAAKELVKIAQNPRCTFALENLLLHGDTESRRSGVQGIYETGPSAWPQVDRLRRKALRDEDKEVRRLACLALGFMRSLAYEAVPDLVRVYQKDEDLIVRRQAMIALSEIVAPLKRPYPEVDKAVPIIKEAAKDEDKTISFIAKQALKTIEKPAK